MTVDVKDFEQDVVQRSFSTPVVVDFWAEWCQPCKLLGPVLEGLATRSNGDWVLAKLDTERLPEVAARQGIRGIPAVKLFVDGQVTHEFVGALPQAQVEFWLKQSLPSKHRRQVQAAEHLVADGKETEAKAVLERVVDAEPENEKARAELGRLLLFDDPARAAQLVEMIEVGEFAEIAEAIRTVAHCALFLAGPDPTPAGEGREEYLKGVRALLDQDFDSALSHFIETIRKDRNYDDDGARKACIAIFKTLGEEHTITQKHRREFSSALY